MLEAEREAEEDAEEDLETADEADAEEEAARAVPAEEEEEAAADTTMLDRLDAIEVTLPGPTDALVVATVDGVAVEALVFVPVREAVEATPVW